MDLTSVDKIEIGFANINGGYRTVLFDDITLCGSKCVADKSSLVADFNSDCVVDFEDLGVIVADWLQSGSAADIHDDGSGMIDLKDFAVLAGEWLESDLWP